MKKDYTFKSVVAIIGFIAITGMVNAQGTLTLSKEVVTAEKQIDLTAEGTLDWAQFSAPEDGSLDVTKEQKDPVVDHIKGLNLVGTPVKGFEGYSGNDWYRFSWTNGVNEPTVTGNSAGIYVTGVNNGISFSVPADQSERTVKIYTDAWNAVGKLVATLSDGSAAEIMNSELEGTENVGHTVFTLVYKAGSAGQKLNVSLIVEVDKLAPGSGGNVSIDAITLSGAPVISGVKNTVSNDKISVYPNPSSGLVNIYMNNSNNARIEVYNMVGKLVHRKNVVNETETIDLSGQKGMYIIKVSNGNSVSTQKLIVQ